MVTPSLPLKAFYKNNIFFQPRCSNFILHSETFWRWSLHRTPHQDTRSRRPGSVQFSSVAQSCPTLCDPMDCSTPGIPVHHQLPELAQTHVHWVGDAIQPSYPLSSPSPPAFNLSQHQGLFQLSQFFASGGQSMLNSLINPPRLASFPLLPHFHILPVFPGIFSQISHLPQILVSGPSLGYPVQGVILLPHFLAMHSGTGQVRVSLFFLTKVVAKNSKQSNIYFKEQG